MSISNRFSKAPGTYINDDYDFFEYNLTPGTNN